MEHLPFYEWLLAPQPRRGVTGQVRAYLRDHPELQPTREEVRSLVSGLYRRLGRGDELTMIEYNPTGSRPEPDAPPIAYSPSKALVNVTGAIERNGFSLTTSTALKDVAHSHRNASLRQQSTVSVLVTSLENDLAVNNVKLDNEVQLRLRDQQRADDLAAQLAETRQDKLFFQDMLRRNNGGRGGNNLV